MFQDFLQIIAEYGWPAILISILLFATYKLGLYLFKSNRNDIDDKDVESPDNMTDVQDLRFHYLFNNLEYRLVAEIPSLELMPNKPTKQQMFRDILSIETKIIYEVCEEIVRTDMTAWNNERWLSEISKKMNEIIISLERKTKEEGIPVTVVKKYLKWHYNSFELLYEYISKLATDNAYSNNYTRTNTLLLIMNLMLITTIADAEKTLKLLNGEIAGGTYKNMIIED